MAEAVRQYIRDFKKTSGKLKELVVDTINGFSAMFVKIVQDGALTVKTKELIAVATQCGPRIKVHVQKCLDPDLTNPEILGASPVAVMMGGGPAWTRMPVVLETVERLQG